MGIIGEKIYTVSQGTSNELSTHLSLPTTSAVANIHVHVVLGSIDYAESYTCKTDERIFTGESQSCQERIVYETIEIHGISGRLRREMLTAHKVLFSISLSFNRLINKL